MTPRRALLLLAIAQTARARNALAAIASNDYANRLYGSSNAIDPTTLRIVWPDLMPPKLRGSLRVECGQPRRQTLFYERHFLQRRALWVHRPPGFEEVFQDKSWVEVTHCAYGTNRTADPFFFAAAGSGLWMNVGHSLRLDFRDERGPDIHRAIADGDFATAARLLGGVDVTTYDSVQFRRMHGGTWPAGVLLTEIAFLNIDGSEADAVSAFHHVIKCGPRRALRHCRADDVAVALQNDCRLSLADDLFTPHANKHGRARRLTSRWRSEALLDRIVVRAGHTPLTDVVPSRGVREVLERSRCAVENCSTAAARASWWEAQIPEWDAQIPEAEAAVERQRQVVAERRAARDRAAQRRENDPGNEKYATNLKNAESSVAHNLEKLRNATDHVDYVRAKTEAARQRARLAEAHRKACVGGDDDLPVVGRRPVGGWGVLLFRFMIGAETTVIVLLLWVAAAGRAHAVGCRGWHIRISI